MTGQIEVIDTLKDIFRNVNIWLHFAEAKNGAIIGVNSLFLFKSIDIVIDMINGDMLESIFLVVIISIVFIIALIISIISFFSDALVFNDETNAVECDTELKNKKVLKVEDRILIFYGHIELYKSSKNYLIDIYKQYVNELKSNDSLSKIELDYAKEILINSRIAARKYKLFNMALKVNVIGLFLTCMLIFIA